MRTKMNEPQFRYPYYDENGTALLYEVVRLEGKVFRARVPDGRGGWSWSLKGVKRVPYNLNKVANAQQVFVVEGEKDADRLQALGMVATCNAFGAGKWEEDYATWFKNKDIVILPDNDDPGIKHANDVANKLSSVAKSIKIVTLPDLPPKGDVSDFLDEGHSIYEIIEISASSSNYQPETETRITETNRQAKNEGRLFEIELKKHIDELNKIYAGIWVGGSFRILKEVLDPESGQPDIHLITTADFNAFFSNQKIPVPSGRNSSKHVPISKLWLESPWRRNYEGIKFSPGCNFPGYYNLFRGFQVSAKRGDWSLFRNHILEIISNNEKLVFNWIIAWMARLVQDPGGERPGTAPVLRGKQGTGKGFFVNTFGKIFGNHFMQIINQTQLTGKFNNHLKDKLLVFVDEGFWAGDKSAEGVLKGMITEDHLTVEPKGKDAFSVKNHINIIMASNNQWVVPAGMEERRFMVTDVSDKRIQDKNYFRQIHNQMKNGGLEAMFHDLLELDISNIDIRTIPRTEALLDQILCSMPTVKKFWFEILNDGKMSISGEWPCEVPSYYLFNEYIEFGQRIHDRYPKSKSQFYKELYELLPNGCEKIQRREGYNGRQRYLKIPELHECKIHFETLLGIKIPWSDVTYAEDPIETQNPFLQIVAKPMSKGS